MGLPHGFKVCQNPVFAWVGGCEGAVRGGGFSKHVRGFVFNVHFGMKDIAAVKNDVRFTNTYVPTFKIESPSNL